jgi:hypothetical protein
MQWWNQESTKINNYNSYGERQKHIAHKKSLNKLIDFIDIRAYKLFNKV